MAQAKTRAKAPRHVAMSAKMQVEIEGSGWEFELTGYNDEQAQPDTIAFQARSTNADKPWGIGGEIPVAGFLSIAAGLSKVLDDEGVRSGIQQLSRTLSAASPAPVSPPTPEQQAEWTRYQERARRIARAVDAEIIARVKLGEITTPEDLEEAADRIRAEVTAKVKAEEQAAEDTGKAE